MGPPALEGVGGEEGSRKGFTSALGDAESAEAAIGVSDSKLGVFADPNPEQLLLLDADMGCMFSMDPRMSVEGGAEDTGVGLLPGANRVAA